MPKLRSQDLGSGSEAETLAANSPRPVPPQFLPDGFPNPVAMDVWQYMELLTPEQWQSKNFHGYLYRTFPLQVRAPGEHSHLEKLYGPTTVEEVKLKYGGGRYRLDLLRDRATVYRIRFTIDGTPKTAPGEVFESTPKQTADGTLVETLVSDVVQQRNKSQEQVKQLSAEGSINKVLELQQEAAGKVVDFAIEQAKRTRAELKNEEARPQGLELLFPLLQPVLKNILERAVAPPDPLAQITPVLTLLDRFESRANPAGSGDWKAAAIAGLSQNFDKLERIVEAWARVQELRTRAAYFSRGAAPAPEPQPAAADLKVTPFPAETPAPAPEAPASTPPSEIEIIRRRIKQTIVRMAMGGDPGEAAAEVADKMDSEFADELVVEMRQNPAAIAADPILGKLKEHPKLSEFLESFLAYFQPETA